MESAEAPVKYIIDTTVTKTFRLGDLWYVHFDGSWESLSLGRDEPNMKPGDKVRITIQRIAP